jgi:hypothetical protein
MARSNPKLPKTPIPTAQAPSILQGVKGAPVDKEARKSLVEGLKKEKKAQFAQATSTLQAMAKEFQAEAAGLIVPFRDESARQSWPAVVIGLNEKRVPKKGPGATQVVARVLVLSGRTQQPYMADLELPEKAEV